MLHEDAAIPKEYKYGQQGVRRDPQECRLDQLASQGLAEAPATVEIGSKCLMQGKNEKEANCADF